MDEILEYWVIEEIENNKLYEMSNLLTIDTGLPSELYISYRHKNKKSGGIRIKVLDNNANFTLYRDSGKWNIRDVQVNKIGSNGVKKIENFLDDNLWLIAKLWDSNISNNEFSALIRFGYRTLKDSFINRYIDDSQINFDKLLSVVLAATEDVKDKDLAVQMLNQRVAGKFSDELIQEIISFMKEE